MLAELDGTLHEPPADPLATLRTAVADSLRRITELAGDDLELALMGSTVTAFLWQGNGVALAHVGDSRGYLLHGGELRQVTNDHTLVQSLVDEGRISPAEAAEHPRRSMLTRALQAGGSAEPDLTCVPAEAGDRFLLCSDGVTGVVGADAIQEVLRTTEDPAAAVRELIERAKAAHSTDNISCVVADVVTADPGTDVVVAGAAAEDRPQLKPKQHWLRRLLP